MFSHFLTRSPPTGQRTDGPTIGQRKHLVRVRSLRNYQWRRLTTSKLSRYSRSDISAAEFLDAGSFSFFAISSLRRFRRASESGKDRSMTHEHIQELLSFWDLFEIRAKPLSCLKYPFWEVLIDSSWKHWTFHLFMQNFKALAQHSFE